MKLVLAAVASFAISSAAFAQSDPSLNKAPGTAIPAATGAQGTGVVKTIDAKAGSVTLQHGPISTLSWPAMTMAFKADPALLKTVKVGQQVTFTVKTGGAGPEVVAIQPK